MRYNHLMGTLWFRKCPTVVRLSGVFVFTFRIGRKETVMIEKNATQGGRNEDRKESIE